ncbi:ubiquitin-specific protease [Peziza echinospora]|nr:ubiquitin-specific protease [Peziza echinospora]
MNHYYPAVPPAVPNGYPHGQRRGQGPPQVIPHSHTPPQPNPYAAPYMPSAPVLQQVAQYMNVHPHHLQHSQHPQHPQHQHHPHSQHAQNAQHQQHQQHSHAQHPHAQHPQHPPAYPIRPPTIVSSIPHVRPQPPPPPPPQAVPLPIQALPPPPPPPQSPPPPPPPPPPISRIPAYPLPGTLPWLSAPDQPFPERPKRRRKQVVVKAAAPKPEAAKPELPLESTIGAPRHKSEPEMRAAAVVAETSATEPLVDVQRTETLETAPIAETNPEQPPAVPAPVTPPPAVPIIPHVPALPILPAKAPAVPTAKVEDPVASANPTPTATTAVEASTAATEPSVVSETTQNATSDAASEPIKAPAPAPAPRTFSSWADLVKTPKPTGPTTAPVVVKTNGSVPTVGKTPLADLIKSFDGAKFSAPVLEPRGLVNTGNMCFMNAILQMIIFCGPFYHFLDLLGKNVAHSFKGDTPLIDTMIVFLREFRVMGQKAAFEKLSGFKEKEYLEAFGEPFVPEFVYGALREVQRFASMRRGHQHDAEEFLGFLLDELHEELVRVLKKSGDAPEASPAASEPSDDGWQEVGPGRKTASTRTTTILESPITKIFGGKLRSEFKVPGLKPSVTLEPYQPLQLDIQSPEVNSIIDALRQLTRPETIHGNFTSPKGNNLTATKQVLIESLPPVLILHLKRFQYDNKGGTQKIWKKIGYPLILEIPKEVVSKRVVQAKYKLTGVVYHHGKSASGGHYTVDVLRQDGKNWIRFDDTVIKGVHANEVKVDIKDIGAAHTLEREEEDAGWERVGNGAAEVGGAANGSQPHGKDSKVAYILFYQRI